ncbi:hypothetical protein [Gemmatimonas groenlandica]|uniref:Uncharacterized protein n=1 Tax=Gemmatimonas groenlandica TaxID=2732249 RepID=A0A6M4IV56_9BACT|nr:hypothetical protein [Gemmatimonas groenlandica]QJR36682.1 hypothetical protein HKW67_14765 [Gemmatimonas groenlandica]
MSILPTLPPPPSATVEQTAPPPPTATRPRAGQRARWLAARTRNAARHGLLIASIGAIVVIAALLLFVLLPRQVDRALAAQIATLPPERDTLPLSVELLAARRELARLESSIAAAAIASRADATVPRAVAASPDTATVAPVAIVRDSATADLQRQLVRIRQAPLVESYRALADTRLLRDDARARAMLDSIEQLHAEREAYAALSGPDARYAAMTARLTQLGQRLTRLAESIYASALATTAATASASASAPVAVTGPTTAVPSSAGTPVGTPIGTPIGAPVSTPAGAPIAAPVGAAPDSGRAASLLVVQQPMADSALERARAAATDSAARAERALREAQVLNANLHAKRDALRARMQLDIPPMAMLLASLVLGLVLGFAFVLWRELRRPTVGDEQELEALTRTRVIVHRAVAASVRATRARRRADEQLPPIMQPTDEAWPLLHLTLSSIGDVSRHVEVVSDHTVLAGAVALNLSAVAAHESRATVLVDAAQRSGALVALLPSSALTGTSPTRAASGATEASEHARWDAPRSLAIGRDTFIDIVLPRRVRSRHTGRDLGGPPDAASIVDDLQRVAKHHDLAVFVTDHDLDQQLPPDTDVVLCARPGVTTLDWLSRTMRQLEERGRRVRAVVLWSADLPLA